MAIKEKQFCPKCRKTMDSEANFYTIKGGGRHELCKQCLTMHVDNYNPDTYVWIIKELNLPYIETEWNKIRDTVYKRDPLGMTGTSVLGRYVSKMKLGQWNKYTWKDTAILNADFEEKSLKADSQAQDRKEQIEQDYKNGIISEAQYQTYLGMVEPGHIDYNQALAKYEVEKHAEAEKNNPFRGTLNQDVKVEDKSLELTDDDKTYLAMKWGLDYNGNQWIKLEKKYTDMQNSFDIQDSDTKSTLILLCKTDLKMNEAIDCGDLDSYQKLSRVYDSLRKSAKFTAAQNKDDKNNFVDSIGELVAYCEKEGGFIPRFATDIPQDKVDVTIKDLKDYTKKLVTQDLGFGKQIEIALQKIKLQKEYEEEMDKLDPEEEIPDQALIEYNEMIDDELNQTLDLQSLDEDSIEMEIDEENRDLFENEDEGDEY